MEQWSYKACLTARGWAFKAAFDSNEPVSHKADAQGSVAGQVLLQHNTHKVSLCCNKMAQEAAEQKTQCCIASTAVGHHGASCDQAVKAQHGSHTQSFAHSQHVLAGVAGCLSVAGRAPAASCIVQPIT